MQTIPIPDGLAQAMGGITKVIGPDDPTRDDLRACEYVITPSQILPGRPVFTALLELTDDDRALLAAGGLLMLQLDGFEGPWAIHAVARP